MSVRNWIGPVVLGLVGLGLAATVASAQATKSASPCKGLEQKACTANAACSWVRATTRKDGRKVRAYCRIKSNRSASKPKT